MRKIHWPQLAHKACRCKGLKNQKFSAMIKGVTCILCLRLATKDPVFGLQGSLQLSEQIRFEHGQAYRNKCDRNYMKDWKRLTKIQA